MVAPIQDVIVFRRVFFNLVAFYYVKVLLKYAGMFVSLVLNPNIIIVNFCRITMKHTRSFANEAFEIIENDWEKH